MTNPPTGAAVPQDYSLSAWAERRPQPGDRPMTREELEKLLAAATPLPWFIAQNANTVGDCTPEDAALIVAAVNALPELLARVRRLESDLKVAHGHEKTLRSLCREAGKFYSQGGIFPIDGEMSKRLQRAGGDWTVSLDNDWQHISSAPKDGTEIDLAYVSEYSGKVFRDPDCKWGRDSDGDEGWMHYERHPEVSYEDTWQLVSYEPFAWRPVTLPARAALNQEPGQ